MDKYYKYIEQLKNNIETIKSAIIETKEVEEICINDKINTNINFQDRIEKYNEDIERLNVLIKNIMSRLK